MTSQSLFQKVGQAGRKVFAGLAVASLFGAGIFTATASGPAFNNLADDEPTLQIAKPGEAWASSTTAQPGDVINLFVWDHNTALNTTAQNVRVKIDVPTGVATTQNFTATISADNAASVTGNASLTSQVPTRVSYVPGSAKFYRNVNNTLTQVNFPAGVNGDNVVTTGVNLGNQQGCWQYVQGVLIQVKIEGGNPEIFTEKKVGLSGGNQDYSNTTTARVGDVVGFRIFLQNTGQATGIKPMITDTLDARLEYVPNSSYIRVKQNNNDVEYLVDDSQIYREGQMLNYTFADMPNRPDAAIFLMFQAKIVGDFPVGTTVLQNCAKSSFEGGFSADTNCVTINVVKDAAPASFIISKQVMNVTNGQNQWYKTVAAVPGNTVAFRLNLTNTGGQAATNVNLKDVLPAGLTFAGDVMLYNTQYPDGVTVAGSDIVTGGHVFSSLVNGNSNMQIIIFKATVDQNVCSGTLTNTAIATFNGSEVARDTAEVVASCSPGLSIVKDVKDPADGQFKDVMSGVVYEGQVITYRITVQNSGNVTLVNPVLRDLLPQYVEYVNNSLHIDGQMIASTTTQTNFKNPAVGFILTNFTPGMSKEITFQVRVIDCPPGGDIAITNTAFVKAEGVAEKSDTARATIRVRKAILGVF